MTSEEQERPMSGDELRAAIHELGWTPKDARERLGVKAKARISEWCTGWRRVPDYIERSVRAHLELKRCGERVERLTHAVQDEWRSLGVCAALYIEDGEEMMCQAMSPCALHSEEGGTSTHPEEEIAP